MQIEIEKPRINPVHFIAIVGGAVMGIIVNSFVLGGVWISLNNTIDDLKKTQAALSQRFEQAAADRKEREKARQQTLDSMNTQIGQIQPLQFQQSRMLEQITENKTAIIETNKRTDRVVESFGGKLDTVIDNVNKVATQVQVLSSKLDDVQGKSADKTTFKTPIVRP